MKFAQYNINIIGSDVRTYVPINQSMHTRQYNDCILYMPMQLICMHASW